MTHEQPSGPRAPRSRGRRILRALALTLGAVIGALLLVIAFLHTGPGQRFLTSRVRAALAERVNGSVELESVQARLFGTLGVRELVLEDAAGNSVVELDRLELRPRWRALLTGKLEIDAIELAGLRLRIEQQADGTSNLSRLFRSRPSTPSKPSQKPGRRIVVHALSVRDVDVTLAKPDGSTLALSDVTLDLSLSAIPSERTLSLDLARLALDLERKTASGARIQARAVRTGVRAELVRGMGSVQLLPLSAELRLERPGKQPFQTPVKLGTLSLEIQPGRLGSMLSQLEAGLALLESLNLSSGYGAAGLEGGQHLRLRGLAIRPERLNALLGKRVLKSAVDLRANVSGPPERLKVDIAITSAGTEIDIDGHVNASRLDHPSYDLELVLQKLDTHAILADVSRPRVTLERLVLGVKGQGIERQRIAADIRLDAERANVRGVAIDRVKLRGRFEHGVLAIHELAIDGLDQKISASGRYTLATREIDAKLTLSGDPGRALAALREAKVPVKTRLPAGALRLLPGELVVEAKGRIGEDISIRIPKGKLRALGGTATIDANVALEQGKLGKIEADVRLSHVDLVSLAKLRGRRLRDVSGSVDGRVSLRGTREAPRIDADLKLRARADDAPAAIEVAVVARGDRGTQKLSVVAERVDGRTRDRLLELEAEVPLRLGARPSLAPGRPLDVELELRKRKLGEISELLPPDFRSRLRRLPPETEVSARVLLGGTTDAPRGNYRVRVDSPLLPAFVDGRQALELGGTIEPAAAGSRASSKLQIWLDAEQSPLLTADADVHFRRSPLVAGGLRGLDWRLALALTEQRLETLPLISARGLSGRLKAEADLAGNERDVTGRVGVTLDDVRRAGTGPLSAKLDARVLSDHSEIDLALAVAGLRALRAHGRVGVQGDDLIPRARARELGDPTLDLSLDVERRRLAEYRAVAPKLAELRGALGGQIRVSGSVRQPLAQGKLALDGFSLLGGAPGHAELELSAQSEKIDVGLDLGRAGRPPALALDVQAPRQDWIDLLRSREATKRAELSVRARADGTLAELVPRLTPKLDRLQASGDLDWSMDARVAIESKDGERSLADGSVHGKLALSRGAVPIPGTKRRYRDVELALSAEGERVRLERLSLSESDLENPKRRLRASGVVELARLRPERVALSLDAHDWLLFGGDTLGQPDAPRAALSAKIDVTGKPRGASRDVEVVVRSLDLRMPDRFEKAHWPERISTGDLIELGADGPEIGKLPRPAIAAKPAPLPPRDPNAPATTIQVSIPNLIHVQKPPFDMKAKGELSVVLVAGEKRPRIDGELRVVDGAMDLGGRDHRIERGKKSRIFFDAEHPAGELDLHLALAPHPAVLRDVSKVSAGGDVVRIHLAGPIAKPVSTVTGVGNADLWDILPVHNAGRVKYTTRPDMPASSSPQLPREYDVVLLSYMAANLPHNLFLDRINAWSDPYDEPRSYGQIRHLEAERYSSDGKTRIRASSRPATIGRSDAELEAGYLLHQSPRTRAGVGAAVGSRGGGGPALFFEWASEN